MSNDTLFAVGDAVLLAGALPVWLFTVLYAGRPWWITAPGRAVFALTASLSLVYVVIVAAVLFDPNETWRGWLRLVVFALVFGAACYLAYTVARRDSR